MKKSVFIFTFLFLSFTIFAQDSTDVSTQKETETTAKPEFGLYDDVADMKRRFAAYKAEQEKVVAEKNTPQDEYLWEAPKGSKDFKKAQKINTYSLERPHDYAANPANNQTVSKTEISNTIKKSLDLGKRSTTTDENWETKLKKD